MSLKVSIDAIVPEYNLIINSNDKEKLSKLVELFNTKKNELITLQKIIQQNLNEIEQGEKAVKARLDSLDGGVSSQGVGTLIIDTHQFVKSKDGDGDREHYKVTLISKNDKQVEVIKLPKEINGEVKQIIITDGVNESLLNPSEVTTSRLIKYLNAVDFDKFRKEINKEFLDHNGLYPNRHWTFDCQRFCHYLQHGKEAEYRNRSRDAYNDAFKSEGHMHRPGGFYAIEAYTDNFRKTYSAKEISLHYYACIANDVYVSKFGESGILFTSYQHIIDAYFPTKFTKGNRFEVC